MESHGTNGPLGSGPYNDDKGDTHLECNRRRHDKSSYGMVSLTLRLISRAIQERQRQDDEQSHLLGDCRLPLDRSCVIIFDVVVVVVGMLQHC